MESSKDSTPKVYPVVTQEKLYSYSIVGHRDSIVGAFFLKETLDTITIASDGYVIFQSAQQTLEEFGRPLVDENGDEIFLYKFSKKHKYVYSNENSVEARVTCVDYNPGLNILATGFEDGLVMTHIIPEFTVLDECQLFVNAITTVSINSSGEWISIGSEELGQLGVWEWRTKSAVMKSDSHANDMTCLSYSHDGLHMATGSADFKIKVWFISGAKNIVTFHEHRGSITGLQFPPAKPKVLISSSLDGTVRAFDLHRYRNFRTLSVPSRQIAFSCLATDDKGSMVAAGGQDTFDAYLWSVQTGMLLACLSGHQAPISFLEFSPSLITEGIEMASGSWDGTVKLWDVGSCYSNTMTAEGDTLSPAVIKNSINCNHDVLAIAYNPEGNQLAVVLINGTISFFDVFTAKEVNFIEGKMDLGCAASEPDDLVNGKRISISSKNFRTISYSLDGQYLIAGGDSKYVCLYSVVHGVLLKRFEITCNMSLAGVQEMHDRRKFLMSLAKGRSGNALEEVEEMRSILQLPGVKTNDRHSRRSWRPEVRVSSIKFSPTGDSFACSSTEGVLLFSQLSSGMRNTSGFNFDWIFDPISGGGLDVDATPLNAKRNLYSGNYASALDIALRLRMYNLLEEIVEKIPVSNVLFLVRNMSVSHVATSFVQFLATQLTTNNTKHIGFYIYWAYCVLRVHAMTLKQGCSSALVSATSFSNPSSNVNMCHMKDADNEELGDRLKKPGVLIEKNEWSLFSGSLLKLEAAVKSINKNWFDKIDAINGTIEYLNVVRKFPNCESDTEKLDNSKPEKMSMDSSDEIDEEIKQEDGSLAKRLRENSFNQELEPVKKKHKKVLAKDLNKRNELNEDSPIKSCKKVKHSNKSPISRTMLKKLKKKLSEP